MSDHSSASKKLSRISGAQNTFLFANALSDPWADFLDQTTLEQQKQFVQKMCRSFYRFETDGLIFLTRTPHHDFEWKFFNSDGSHADMCGNAARCAAAFFNREILKKEKVSFLTGAGEIFAEIISSEKVRVSMTPISQAKTMVVQGVEGIFVNSGVPHFVIFQKPDRKLAESLRKVSDFGPEGANITFVWEDLKAVTFERGVEDFTQACGTGAVAAAIATNIINNQDHQQRLIHMPGGDLLIENIYQQQRPFLTGPVRFEFEIENWEMS